MHNISNKNSHQYSAYNKVKLIRGGKEYFHLILSLIKEAKESIHLQTYIYSNDETGCLVAEALKEAAKRGLQVYLLVDGYASQRLPKKFINELRHSGVHFLFFEPFFKSKFFYFGRRMHHKIFVADTRYALVGGVNISNRYNDMPEQPAWLDFALYAEGEIVKKICILCWKTWNDFPKKMNITSCERAQLQFQIKSTEKTLVRMRRNDWVRRKNEISATYIEMLRNAHSHILIVCSYFLPGKIIRKLLLNASKKGVKIKIITAGQSDIKLVKHAERWLYDWLLRTKIELYEYQPVILHAKIAVCDSQWLTIGSYNINNISTYTGIELNLDVKNTAFATETEMMMKKIIEDDCIAITHGRHMLAKNVFVQFLRWASYQFIRSIFFIITFYYKRQG